jgi:plasmid stabilization system protein ParE
MRVLVFRPEVEAEILDACRYYENSRAGLGKAFENAVNVAFDRIVTGPLAPSSVDEEIRRVFVRGFPYGIYYEVLPALIRVVAVVHKRRHPRRWQRRKMITMAVGQSRERKR